jgi:hypothetical protein
MTPEEQSMINLLCARLLDERHKGKMPRLVEVVTPEEQALIEGVCALILEKGNLSFGELMEILFQMSGDWKPRYGCYSLYEAFNDWWGLENDC